VPGRAGRRPGASERRPRCLIARSVNRRRRDPVHASYRLKSGRAPRAFPGLGAFAEAFKPKCTLLVGADGISLEEFLTKPVEHWLQA
jgi:hypothetical protein